MLRLKALFLGSMAVLMAGFAPGGEAIPNWSAPATWTPTRGTGVHTMADVTSPAIFVGVTPCRVADTRGNGFTGQYGPPSLVANANRNFTISGVCGIPSGAAAVSFNFAALNVGAQGDLRVFPAGGGVPLASTLNYNGNTPNIANAAVIPLGTSSGITVRADAVSVDLIIDVNGYYLDQSGTINTSEYVGINGNTGSSSGGLLFVDNASAGTGAFVSAVRGQLLSGPNGAAVIGEAFPTTPGANGIRGLWSGNADNGAAILGMSGFAQTNQLWSTSGAGVRGEGKNGVVGVTSATGGGESGIAGIVTNSTGGLGPYGYLGFGFTSKAVMAFGDYGGTGAKYFLEPHPTNPMKMIEYVCLESAEAGTYFRGTASISDGEAIITVPEDFRLVTDTEGLSVQLTPVGAPASMYVVTEDLNQIVVHSDRDVKFHYMVNGVRASFKDHKPIVDALGVYAPLSRDAQMSSAFSPEQRRRLIANGTYNADGTINMETARAMGWTRIWEEREGAKVFRANPPSGNKPD